MKKFNIDEYILKNYKNKTNAQMALECGCCKSTISNHRVKLGISATDLNNELREKIPYICSQKGKKTKAALAKELNCSISFIKKIWTENNLTNTTSKVYYYDENYFDTIDCLEKAYWLGFLAADGNLYRRDGHQGLITLSLKNTDIEVLENLKKQLKTEKPISLNKDKRREDTIMATLQLSSDKLFNQLLALGIGVRKTFDLSIKDIFANIPKQFWKGFLLGYFDGDGSISLPDKNISKSHVRYSGPLTNLNDFKMILEEIGITCEIVEDKRNYSKPFGSLEFKNTTEKYNFLKYIYSSNINCLTRKKEKAGELIQRIEQNITNRNENIKALQHYKSVVLKWEELLES